MKIQILIPHYHEPEEMVKPLLDSLEVQQRVEFSVIICNDGDDVLLSDEFLGRYSFPIEYFVAEHGGLSATRNKLMDRATAEYICFCDADDMFFHAYGLWMMMKKAPYDMLISAFVEETPEGFITRTNSPVWVHGKAYRLQYLRDNDIRFNESLVVNEDSAFNMMAGLLTENRAVENVPFYMWKYRPDSTVRRDPLYRFREHHYLTKGGLDLVHEFERRGMKDKAGLVACSHIMNGYRSFVLEERGEWPPDLKEKALIPFRAFMKEVGHYWDEADGETKLFMLTEGEYKGIMAEDIDDFIAGA